jgi:vacuolar-type H+-ATPase subunit E/Vma4
MTTAVTPPTEPAPETLSDVLEPVRQALLGDARAEADRIASVATHCAKEVVAAAKTEADAEVERARHRAALSATAHADQILARVSNDAHRVELDTQEELRRELIDDVHTSARDIRRDPRYPALLDHLESLARSQLGAGAIIERDPHPDGGIVAVAGSRRVDYRLPVLANRALDTLADDVAELWT